MHSLHFKIQLLCVWCRRTSTLKVASIHGYSLCLLLIWSYTVNKIESILFIQDSYIVNASNLNDSIIKEKNLIQFIKNKYFIHNPKTNFFDVHYIRWIAENSSTNFYNHNVDIKNNNNTITTKTDAINNDKNYNINKSNEIIQHNKDNLTNNNNNINKSFNRKDNINNFLPNIRKNINNPKQKKKRQSSKIKNNIADSDDGTIIFVEENYVATTLQSTQSDILPQITLNRPNKCRWPVTDTLFIIDSTIYIGGTANHRKILQFVNNVTKHIFFNDNNKETELLSTESNLALVQFTPEVKFEFGFVGEDNLERVEQKINVINII